MGTGNGSVSSERRHVEEPDNDLNLIPMMNLICLLIPFLLLSAEFIKHGGKPAGCAGHGTEPLHHALCCSAYDL